MGRTRTAARRSAQRAVVANCAGSHSRRCRDGGHQRNTVRTFDTARTVWKLYSWAKRWMAREERLGRDLGTSKRRWRHRLQTSQHPPINLGTHGRFVRARSAWRSTPNAQRSTLSTERRSPLPDLHQIEGVGTADSVLLSQKTWWLVEKWKFAFCARFPRSYGIAP